MRPLHAFIIRFGITLTIISSGIFTMINITTKEISINGPDAIELQYQDDLDLSVFNIHIDRVIGDQDKTVDLSMISDFDPDQIGTQQIKITYKDVVKPVNVTIKPIVLDVPEITIFGEMISWNEVEHADSYKVIINFEEFETTETSFDITNSSQSGELNIVVQAIPNEVYYYKSENQDPILVSRLDLVKNVNFTLNLMTWDQVNGADYYKVIIDEVEHTVVTNSIEEALTIGEHNISIISYSNNKEYIASVEKALTITKLPLPEFYIIDDILFCQSNLYECEMKINGVSFDGETAQLPEGETTIEGWMMPTDNTDVQSDVQSITLHKLATPIISIENNQLVYDASKEIELYVDGILYTEDLSNLSPGTYNLSARYKPQNVNEVSSDISVPIVIEKIPQPTISVENDQLHADTELPITYYLDGELFDGDLLSLPVGTNQITAKTSLNGLNKLDSDYSNILYVMKLATPQNISVIDQEIHFDQVNYATSYSVMINGETFETNTNSFNINGMYDIDEIISIEVKADSIGNNIESSYSQSYVHTVINNFVEELNLDIDETYEYDEQVIITYTVEPQNTNSEITIELIDNTTNASVLNNTITFETPGNVTVKITADGVETSKTLMITHKSISSLSDITDMEGYYSLINDIDMSGVTYNQIGNEVNPFNGELYCSNHTISNVTIHETINNPMDTYIGLFRENNGLIQDCNFTNVSVDITSTNVGEIYFGLITPENSGTILDVSVQGVISIDSATNTRAGSITSINNGVIDLVRTDVIMTVNTNDNDLYLGGIAGINNNVVSKSSSEGDVTVLNGEYLFIGGVNGESNNATVTEVSSTISFDISGGLFVNVGGVEGFTSLSILDNVSFNGNILVHNQISISNILPSATDHRNHIGGITGINNFSEIYYANTSGNINSIGDFHHAIGGIAGKNIGYIAYSTSSMNLTGTNTSGSLSIGGIAGIMQSNYYNEFYLTVDNLPNRTLSSFGNDYDTNDSYINATSYRGSITVDTSMSPTTGFSNIGGIAGVARHGAQFRAVYSTADITVNAETTGNIYGGGIIGLSEDAGTLQQVYNVGNIYLNNTGNEYGGGIIAYEIDNSYINQVISFGNITADTEAETILGHGSISSSSLLPTGKNYKFINQVIVTTLNDDQYDNTVTYQQLHDLNWYLNDLEFDPNIWNLELGTVINYDTGLYISLFFEGDES